MVVPVPDKEKYPNIPEDYVVVADNTHQLPLGVLKFGTVDPTVMSRSQQRRMQLKQLSADLAKQETEAMDCQTKAYIIQLLIQGKFDLAAEKYDKFHKLLKEESKREISMYAHDTMDPVYVEFLMPNLPEPYSKKEFESKAGLKTVEKHVRDAQSTKEKLEQASRQWGMAQSS